MRSGSDPGCGSGSGLGPGCGPGIGGVIDVVTERNAIFCPAPLISDARTEELGFVNPPVIVAKSRYRSMTSGQNVQSVYNSDEDLFRNFFGIIGD